MHVYPCQNFIKATCKGISQGNNVGFMVNDWGTFQGLNKVHEGNEAANRGQ